MDALNPSRRRQIMVAAIPFCVMGRFLIVLFNSLANTETRADTRVNFINCRIHRKYSGHWNIVCVFFSNNVLIH